MSSSSFDAAAETQRLIEWLKETCLGTLRRQGGVVGISGGVDSATVLHLLVHALGANRVVALMLPDRDSSPESEQLARDMAEKLGVEAVKIDLTAGLAGFGCYDKRDGAVKRTVPEFDPAVDKMKIVLPQNLLGEATMNVFSVVVTKPDGTEIKKRLNPRDYLEIVAASNMKQRARMSMLYYEAERRNFCVVGTANKNEHGLGFFVKYGDGGVDLQPIAHLFKTQVYEIAKCIGVAEAIIQRPPTTDTYSAEQSQEEFFYRLPFEILDAIWNADELGLSTDQIALEMDLTPQQVENVLNDIHRKQRTTEYLRSAPPIPPSVN
jgi:NAD+ synthase